MFGIGLATAYGNMKLDWLGGTSVALVYAIVVRLLVGVGWYLQFKKAGKNPVYGFIPLVGEYTAFRSVWDDFSFSFIFATTTVIAFIDACLTEQTNMIITACAVINFIMWWIFALLSARAYGVGTLMGFIYGGIPWFGSLLFGFWPNAQYKGAWSSNPEDERNLTTQQIKTKRKKEARAAKAKEEQEKKERKQARKAAREAGESE